ncbi:MAG TPA: hypothetical protein VMT89_08095 [Candidatus Acidoferrales bacterium]|nr:hypothetical protein [Candidatus Acidoferrales bacterium]
MGNLKASTLDACLSSRALRRCVAESRSLTPTFCRAGDHWVLAYDGFECRLPDDDGLAFVATLLRQPGTRLAAASLVSSMAVCPECDPAAWARATIESALQTIAARHYSLGLHLRATIKTGITCAYIPDPRVPIEWQL